MSINTAELNQLVDKALEGIDKAEAVMRGLYSQLEDAQGEIRALRATEAGLLERVKTLEFGISEVETLIDESDGVAGLHLNGDVAPWGELRSGGRFEAWLLGFDEALALLEKQQ